LAPARSPQQGGQDKKGVIGKIVRGERWKHITTLGGDAQ